MTLIMNEYVTGECLQQLADLTIATPEQLSFQPSLTKGTIHYVTIHDFTRLSPTHESILAIRKARSLFVYTHLLDAFFQYIYPHLNQGFVLLTHNSDHGITERYLPYLNDINTRISAWFAQNICIRHPKLHPLPIGIANSQWAHGNLAALNEVRSQLSQSRKEKLCYFNFNVATAPNTRAHVKEICLSKSIPMTPSLETSAYLQYLASHKYAICPEGNGVDTHRMWECLYLGVIPIVSESMFVEALAPYDLPILVLVSWNDLSEALLVERYPILVQKFNNTTMDDIMVLSKIRERVNILKNIC